MIKLDSNENLFGASPAALQAAALALNDAHLYPDSGGHLLRAALAEFLHLQPTQITLGNGSENILELIVKAFLRPHDVVILSQYAFLTIPLILDHYSAQRVVVPAKQFSHDLSGMLAAISPHTRLIFIVNPNNPTGTCVDPTELRQFLDTISSSIYVVLDEAYFEYLPVGYPNCITWLAQYPNLIITRTFSKAYGLAGLRLGYALSSVQVAASLQAMRLPYNVNRITLAAAQAALADQSHITHTLAMTREGRVQLEQGLQRLKIHYIPSQGNFISVDFKQNSHTVCEIFRKNAIFLRPLQDYGLVTFFRVTIGKKEQNAAFLELLGMQ